MTVPIENPHSIIFFTYCLINLPFFTWVIVKWEFNSHSLLEEVSMPSRFWSGGRLTGATLREMSLYHTERDRRHATVTPNPDLSQIDQTLMKTL